MYGGKSAREVNEHVGHRSHPAVMFDTQNWTDTRESVLNDPFSGYSPRYTHNRSDVIPSNLGHRMGQNRPGDFTKSANKNHFSVLNFDGNGKDRYYYPDRNGINYHHPDRNGINNYITDINGTKNQYTDINGTNNYYSDINGINNYLPNKKEDKKAAKKKKKKKNALLKIFSKYSERTSLNGIPFITATGNVVVKAIWTFVLLATIAAMLFHLYSLVSKFLSYEKHSQINLTFNNLQFPAVTICNANMMRKSKTDKVPPEVNDLLKKLDPFYQTNIIANCTESDFDECIGDIITGEYETEGETDETEGDTWEKESKDSNYDDGEKNFTAWFNALEPELRKSYGHQIKDMLIRCSFAGQDCYYENFTHVFSTTFGNCYTLEYSKFISRNSGPKGGLELFLFLENDEYIDGMSSGRGIQVVIHDQETVPFPTEDGFAIMPETQTILGLRQVKVNRLGSPYGSCNSSDAFRNIYNVTYTRTACQRICLQKEINSVCKCIDGGRPDLNSLIYKNMSLPICVDTGVKCMNKVKKNFISKVEDCGCNEPCIEAQYQHSISARQWPSPSYAKMLANIVCKNRLSDEICHSLMDKTSDDQRKEFIKLNIYYQDLNFESLSEAPDYEVIQFLSDIGGTIGLWIGLSVVGMCEIVYLLFQLIFYTHSFCTRNKKMNHPTRD